VLLALIARGRNESVPPTIVSGVEHFDVSGVTQTIADAVQVFSGLPLSKSRTAYILYASKVFRALIGDDATDAQIASMREELDEALSQEELMMTAMADGAGATDPSDGGGGGGGGGDDGQDAGDDQGDAEPPIARGATRFRSKPMKK
jgi:hypothetical protein